jgi:hypothetical protein
MRETMIYKVGFALFLGALDVAVMIANSSRRKRLLNAKHHLRLRAASRAAVS